MKNKVKVGILALCMTVTALAAKVDKIEIKNLKELNQQDVLSQLNIKVGSDFTDTSEKEIYDTLIKSGLFSDVKINANKKLFGFGNVDLEIEVTESSNIKQVLYNMEVIKQLSKRTDLTVKSLKVEGLKNVDISPILNSTELKVNEAFVPITVNQLAESIFRSGYFREVVPVVNRDANNKTVDVIIKVVENPEIKTVKLEGITIFNEEEVINAIGLRKGQIFNANLLNPETSPLLQAYVKAGVATPRLLAANISEKGEVYIKVSEGVTSSVEFKKKFVTQDNKRLTKSKTELKTKDFVFQRSNYIKTGEILTESAIKNTMEEIFRTGLFDSIEPVIEADATNENLRKITFLVTERPTTSINGNVSYETKEGLTGGVTFTDKNFLGNNQDIALQVSFGTKGNYELNASFFDPWIKGTDKLQIGGSVFFKREKAKRSDLLKGDKIELKTASGGKETFEEAPYQVLNVLRDSGSYIYGGSLTLGKGFQHNIFATVKPRIFGIRTTNAEHIAKDGDKKALQPKVDYTLGSVTLGLSYDTRDDISIPKNGFYVSGSYELGYIFREKSLTTKALTDLKEDINKYLLDLKGNVAVKPKYEALMNAIKNKRPKAEIETAREDYNKAVEKYLKDNDQTLPSIAKNGTAPYKYSKETLKTRPYHIFNLDARAYHKVYKDKNSMAYRLTLGYASKGTPENMLFSTYNGGTTLRGYADEKASIIATATVENRTYINNYAQLVLFGEVGVNNKAIENGFYGAADGNYVGLAKYQGFKETFTKANVKADIGVGARLTTPLGVIRLDYAWPLMNTESKSGKFSFGFGQTF